MLTIITYRNMVCLRQMTSIISVFTAVADLDTKILHFFLSS